MKFYKLYSLFLIALFINNLQAQTFKNSDYFLESGLRYGSALYHPTHDIYLRDSNFGSLEMRFGMQTHGENAWEQAMNNPVIGVALRYTDYTGFGKQTYQIANSNNLISEQEIRKELLGSNLALFGYLQAPILRYKWFTWHYQIGMGFGALPEQLFAGSIYLAFTYRI